MSETETTTQKTNKDVALMGCNFDALTAEATHGKDVIFFLSSQDDAELLAVAGQQGLTVNVEVEMTETQTKGTGKGAGWTVKTPGNKSWSASTDGLMCLDDPARKTIVRSIANGWPLCAGVYVKDITADGTKYTPIRKGLVYASSDELDAPNNDNMTFSTSFEGTGELWMCENVTDEEIEAMSFWDNGELESVLPDEDEETDGQDEETLG